MLPCLKILTILLFIMVSFLSPHDIFDVYRYIGIYLYKWFSKELQNDIKTFNIIKIEFLLTFISDKSCPRKTLNQVYL